MVRCALAPLPDGSFNVLVRDSGEGEFRHLLTIPPEDATSTDVVSFSGDGRSLLMISAAGSDTGRLTRVDLATGGCDGPRRGPGGGRVRRAAAPGHARPADRHRCSRTG